MSALTLNPYSYLVDTKGTALDAGLIYIGLPNQDPVTSPIALFYDAALTVVAPNPVPTLMGYAVRNGSPTLIYAAESRYSLRAVNRLGVQVFYNPVVSGIDYVKQPFSGAVDRTQHDKNSDYLTLQDFGGVCNGVANDADAMFSGVSAGYVTATGTAVNADFSDAVKAKFVLENLHKLDCKVPTTIKLPSGVMAFSGSRIATLTAGHANLQILGADPVVTDLQSVASVTLTSAGVYTVVYNLASAAGIAVNDILKLDYVRAGQSFFESLPIRRPHFGELVVGFNKMGVIDATGTTVTVGKNATQWLAVGDLLTIRGQTRIITAVNNDLMVTIDSAFDSTTQDLDSDLDQQWWYYTPPAMGTINSSGVTVTGTGTSFTTQINVGDLILCDGVMALVTAIASNTSLTIGGAISGNISGAYSVVTAGILHEGSHTVTAVSGNQVTVRLRCHSEFAPPVRNVTGGVAMALKTVLKQSTGGDGFVCNTGTVIDRIDNLAVQGNFATTGTGFLLKGKGQSIDTGAAHVTLGENVSIVEFGKGVWGYAGCQIMMPYAHVSGCNGNGLELGDGAGGYLRGSVVQGCNGIGLFESGAYTRISTARFNGNKLQGIRMDVGGNCYGDSVFYWGNASNNIMLVNSCGFQSADGYSIASGSAGINCQNGGSGRISRTLFAGSKSHNIYIANAKMEGSQCWATGARTGRSGVIVDNGEFDITNGACTGNASVGMFAFDGGRLVGRNAVTRKNATGQRADGGALINSLGSYNQENGLNRSTASDGKIIDDANPTGGTRQIASHLTAIVTMPDDSILTIPIGNTVLLVSIVGSTAAAYGQVRTRVGSSATANIIAGVGLTVTSGATVPTGTTGADGSFNIFSSTNGNLYFENRTGASFQITYQIMGNVL